MAPDSTAAPHGYAVYRYLAGSAIDLNRLSEWKGSAAADTLAVFLRELHALKPDAEVDAMPPAGGVPTDPQLLTMMQNLIKSRFNLSLHTEKRELSVYAISIGKAGLAGIKMVKNDSSGLQTGAAGLGRRRFRGATMADFAGQLQLRVLDRPVIDQSGLTGRFDFTLNWTPDEFQFPAASAAQRSAIPTGPNAPADLFTAVQEQIGMKLEATKARADVFVIDSVSRPSEN